MNGMLQILMNGAVGKLRWESLLSLVIVCLMCSRPAVAQPLSDPYDVLSRAIMQRHFVNGESVNQDSPTPLLWIDSSYLLREPSKAEFLSALEAVEMLSDKELHAWSSYKRAMLQHRLWAVFDWTAKRRVEAADPVVLTLQPRLASLIRRLALSAQENQALQESISLSAVEDAGEPSDEGPTLPEDLFDSSGPWVCLRRDSGGLVAPTHSTSSEWRSAFLVFMRVPEGRPAALDYLNRLGSFRDTVVRGQREYHLNPNTPQFPAGTQFALVERPLLISNEGEPVMSPLCFRIQLRSYRSVTQRFIPELSDEPTQFVSEYVLRPKQLVAGAGALEPLRTGDLHYATFFTNDPFESRGHPVGNNVHRALTNCMVCHSSPGILSVNSRAFTQVSPELPVRFREGTPEEIGAQTSLAKQEHFTWGLLQGLWRHGMTSNP